MPKTIGTRRAARAALLLLFSLAPSPALAAQRPFDLAAALEGARSDLRIEAGELAGPGAARLGEAAADAQFVLLGEDHGLAEIPAFATALHRVLQPAGFDTLAIETGPRAASEVERILGLPERRARFQAFLSEYPFALAFYDLAEELAFLESAADRSGPHFRLIGFDQELMGAGKLLLRQARALARGAATAARLDALLEAEAQAYARAARSGNPAELFLMTAPRAELEGVRDALAAESAAAARPLDALLASRAIYELHSTDGYRSNLDRAALMRENLRAALPGVWPKLLVKAGAFHAYKGINPLGSREIGNFLAEIAELTGGRSLHLLVVGAAGEQARFAGIGRPPAVAPIEVAAPGSPLAALAPLLEVAARHEPWSLFDLRPLRPRLLRAEPRDPELERIVFGFDFALVFPRATAARPLVVPVEE